MDIKVLEKLPPNVGSVEKILIYVRKEAEHDEHLQTCILKESKSVQGMVDHIATFAQKQQRTGKMTMIDDEVVYGQAIHYFLESEDDLKKEDKKTPMQKKEKVVIETTYKQPSLFDFDD